MSISCPYTGSQTIKGIIGDGNGFLRCFESGYTGNGTEDLFLENTHFVMASQNGGLDIVAVFQTTILTESLAAAKDLSTFFSSDIDIGKDLFVLIVTGLRSHHYFRIQGITQFDGEGSFDHPLHEFIIDRCMHENTGRTGTYFSLIQGKHHRAFYCFVKKIIIRIHHTREEDIEIG